MIYHLCWWTLISYWARFLSLSSLFCLSSLISSILERPMVDSYSFFTYFLMYLSSRDLSRSFPWTQISMVTTLSILLTR